jgi:hypothetical protein
MPARFINAVVFVHARSDRNVQDGIARYLAKSDLCDIAKNEDKLKRVMRADAILTRTRFMIFESKDVACHTKLELFANFTVSIVEATLAIKNSLETRNIDEIVADFADRFSGLTSGAASAASASPAPEAMEPQSVSAVSYNKDGTAEGIGRSSVLRKGFAVGMFVRPRTSSIWAQFETLAIEEDGTVKLQAVIATDGSMGDLASVDRETFISDYVITHHQIEIQADYPFKDASNSRALREAAMKGALCNCLYQLALAHPAPNARVFSSPAKTVIALEQYAKGALVLTPATLSIGIDRMPYRSSNDRAIVVRPCTADTTELDFHFLLQPCQTTEFINLMWCAKVDNKRSVANCEMIEVKYVQTLSLEGERRNSRPPAPTASNPVTFGIMCARNFRDIKKHEEIVIYQEARGGPGPAKKHKK